MPKPNAKMGDWVHYHLKTSIDRPMVTMPALITSVIEGSQGLRVTLEAFHPNRGVLHFGGGVGYAAEPKNEHWSWPPVD